MVRLFVLFFFFKQKTAYEMRISDWSSDVCSSDLRHRPIELRLSGSRTCTTLAVATGARLVSKARQAGTTESPQNSSSCLTLSSRSATIDTKPMYRKRLGTSCYQCSRLGGEREGKEGVGTGRSRRRRDQKKKK